jgi:hypothetical protein
VNESASVTDPATRRPRPAALRPTSPVNGELIEESQPAPACGAEQEGDVAESVVEDNECETSCDTDSE